MLVRIDFLMKSLLEGIVLSATLLASAPKEEEMSPIQACTYRLHMEDTFLLGEKKS